MGRIDLKCLKLSEGHKLASAQVGKRGFVFFFAMQLLLGTFVLSSCRKAVRARGTSDASNGFAGLKSFKPRPDGTWLLEWDKIPELNLTYEVYSREDSGQTANFQPSFDFNSPLVATTEGYYITGILTLKKNTCFAVRVRHKIYVDTNTKEFCTGTIPVTASIIKITAPPNFSKLSLVNAARDGYLNAEEVLSNLSVVSLEASGFDTADYAVVTSSSSCDASQIYVSSAPLAGELGITDGASSKVCVRLKNAFGDTVYGASDAVVIDKSPPTAAAPTLINLGPDGKLNSASQTANLPVIAFSSEEGTTVGYAVAESVNQCQAGLSFVAGVPSAAHSAFVTGSSRVVCVEVGDVAGNVAYNSSPVITTDTQAPMSAVMSASVLADGILSISENVSAGFALEVKGEPSAGFTVTCTTNCSVVSGGTVAAGGASTSGNLSSSGMAMINIKAVASGAFELSTVLTDSFGNSSTSSLTGTADLSVGGSSPIFNSLILVNGAVDGKMNSDEKGTSQIVVALDATGFETAHYALIDSTASETAATINTSCSGATYVAGPPVSNATEFTDGSSKRVCVKLANSVSAETFGYSDLIEVDLTAPAAPTVNVAYDALDFGINTADVTANQDVVIVSPGTGESVGYAVAANSGLCNDSLSYSSSVPKAGHSDFINGTSRVVCAKLSDAAGNAAFGSSAAMTIDTQAPVPPFVDATALSDNLLSSAENLAGGFAVVLNGEANANFILTCASNCTIVSGGTVAVNSLSSTGALDPNGTFTVNVLATSTGSFEFNVVLSDAVGNSSTATSVSKTADLDSPTITVTSATPATVNSSQTTTFTLNFSDVAGSGVLASAVNIANTDIVFSGASLGCVATVSGSGSSSRTVAVTGCAAASGNVGFSLAPGKIADVAGNESAAFNQSTQFAVSNAPPALSITLPLSNAVKDATSFDLEGTCVDGLTVIVSSADLTTPVTSETCTSGSYAISIQLAGADGSKNVLVTSQDAAGQVSSAVRTFIKDTAGPTVMISPPSAMYVRQSSTAVTYQVSFTDASGVASVNASPTITKVTTGGADCDVNLPAISGTGPYSVSIENCTGNGTFKITVGAGAATDTVGQQSAAATANAVINVDNIVPSAPSITAPAGGTTFTSNPVTTAFQGTCESGAKVTLGGDVAAGQMTTCSGGTFSFSSWTLAVGNTSKSVTVTQTDAAGNVSSASVARSFTLNAVPFAPSLTPATVSGFKPSLIGTCDSTAASHAVTATGVARVRSWDCTAGGVLTVVVHLPAGAASTFTVTVTSTNAQGSSNSGAVSFDRNALTCPDGYVGVPGSGIVGLGHQNASDGNGDWWLDVSQDFCVMKYPAKEGGSGATLIGITTPTTLGDAPWTHPDDSISHDNAHQYCQNNSGMYYLISNTQWQTVVRNAESVDSNWSGGTVGSGVMARGHTDNNPPNSLGHAADTDPYFGTGNSASDGVGSGWEQRRTHTLSNGEVIWDMGGNVWQWVADEVASLGVDGTLSGLLEFNTGSFPFTSPFRNRLLFAPNGNYDSTKNIGKLNGASAGGIIRGGDWNSGVTAGLFAADLSFLTSHSAANVGFRCVITPSP